MSNSHNYVITATIILLITALPVLGAPYLLGNLQTDSGAIDGSEPRDLTALGTRVLFIDDVGRAYATDGTAMGTERLTHDASFDRGFVAWHDDERAILTSFETSYLTDGTAAGTIDLGLRIDHRLTSDDRVLELADGRFIVMVGTRNIDREIWILSGIPGDASRLPGPNDPSVGELTHFDGDVVFVENIIDGDARSRLWRTDGTTAHVVAEWPFTSIFTPTVVNGSLVFQTFINGGDGQQGIVWRIDPNGDATELADGLWFPRWTVDFGDSHVVWLAGTGPDVVALLASDGTPEGTGQITPDLPGFEITEPTPYSDADGMVVALDDGVSGRELWVSDGSADGTRLLVDLCPGICNADPVLVGPLGPTFLVAADDGTTGRELWRVDRTTGDATQMLDLCLGPCSGVRWPELGGGGDTIFFGGHDGTSRPQLYVTDGTADGTRQLTDFSITTAEPIGEGIFANGRLVLGADDGIHGPEPWVSDGTPGGTELIADLRADADLSSLPVWLGALDHRVVFRTFNLDSGMWVSDGTKTGTFELQVPVDVAIPNQGLSALDRVFFTATDNGVSTLWVTDGTVDGTDDLLELPADGAPFEATVETDDRLFFTLPGSSTDHRLWVSDGAGTFRYDEPIFRTIARLGNGVAVVGDPTGTLFHTVGDRLEAVAGAPIVTSPLATTSGHVIFASADGLWSTDGDAVTQLLAFTLGEQVELVESGAGRVWVLTRESNGPDDVRRLWVTDGTPGGTRSIIPFGDPIQLITAAGATDSHFFFVVLDLGTYILWSSDGLVATPVWSSDDPYEVLAVRGDQALVHQEEGPLFFTDGTTAGTMDSGLRSPHTNALATRDHFVFGAARDNDFDTWVSDGTVDGTRSFTELFPDHARQWETTLATDSRLFLAGRDDDIGIEPYVVTLTEIGAGALDLATDDRFSIAVEWDAPDGARGYGTPEAITDDTGTFYFFDQDNLELMIKVLDGRAINGHWWAFYASLSNVGFRLTVTDSETGELRTYENAQGTFASRGDIRSFADAPPAVTVQPAAVLAPRMDCGVENALCLNDGRFAVTVDFQDFNGVPGVGHPVPLTDDTGAFWFFDATNLEMMVKVLDGTAINGRWWVFYGGLSNVAYTLTVTDTTTGAVRIYENPAGSFGSRGDIAAF
ncbi:MAG: hypothetical protein AAGD38_13815 [Acidobacteriota bacterium]